MPKDDQRRALREAQVETQRMLKYAPRWLKMRICWMPMRLAESDRQWSNWTNAPGVKTATSIWRWMISVPKPIHLHIGVWIKCQACPVRASCRWSCR